MPKVAKPKPFRKPRPDFPLTPHPAGYWCKKVRGKIEYFGRLDSDPEGEAALLEWLEHKDSLLAGRGRRSQSGGLTVEDLCDHFLTAKEHFVETGELVKRTYDEYHAAGQRLINTFGADRLVDSLCAADFDKLRAGIAEQWGPARLGKEIQLIRTLFKFGFEAGHIEKPVRFGPDFRKPSKKTLRQHRATKGPRMFEPGQIQKLLATGGVQFRAMLLLGINAGLGNQDCATLPLAAVDLKGGWLNFPRPKTGIARRCPLWPETIEALKAAIAKRPTPKAAECEHRLFVTKSGGSWAKETSDNPISKEMTKLLKEFGIHRPGLGFYALRHTFETIGGESRDQVAVDHIMGHARDDMASLYRERISDERLQAVVGHVHEWLWPTAVADKTKPKPKAKPAKKPQPRVATGKQRRAVSGFCDDGPVLLRLFA